MKKWKVNRIGYRGSAPIYHSGGSDYEAEQLEKYGLKPTMMVDCSHANSMKDYRRQVDVCNNVAEQVSNGENRIMGVMLESHLVEGRQDVIEGQKLTFGQSVTDACISWETTETCLAELAEAVRKRREINAQQASA